MEEVARDWLARLEAGRLAQAVRQEAWLFPLLEVVHILGFVVLVGAAFAFDVRLLGRSRHVSVRALAHHLLPWSIGALGLVVPSGLLLFASQATTLGGSRVFHIKLLLIGLAGLNAGFFHLRTFRSVARWDTHAAPPPPARVAAVLSLSLWTAVIVCGRLLAYV